MNETSTNTWTDPRAASAHGGLVFDDVRVDYGPAYGLHGLTLTVTGGTAFAILGVNGSGKSTFGRAASGLVPVRDGQIYFDGNNITGKSPQQVSRLGLRYIPEGRGIFPGMSVSDNLRQAVLRLSKGEQKRAIADTFDLFPVLAQRRDQRSGTMSGGEQQMLAMSLALIAKPRLIIADEMSLGLAPKMVTEVFDSLQRAKDTGITIVLIEQFIHRALAFADDCAIFHRGQTSWAGRAEDAGPGVLDSYLGETSSA
jgi:branched-chain amino acid transport system ATP-binding protein